MSDEDFKTQLLRALKADDDFSHALATELGNHLSIDGEYSEDYLTLTVMMGETKVQAYGISLPRTRSESNWNY